MTEILLVLGIFWLLAAAGVFVRYLRRRRGWAAMSIAENMESVTAGVAAIATDYKAMRTEVETARRQRDEIAEKVGSILAERDEWKELYHRQASEHSAAQDVMMREIESLRRQHASLTGRLKKVKTIEEAQRLASTSLRTDPVIDAIGKAFASEHGDAIAAARTLVDNAKVESPAAKTAE